MFCLRRSRIGALFPEPSDLGPHRASRWLRMDWIVAKHSKPGPHSRAISSGLGLPRASPEDYSEVYARPGTSATTAKSRSRADHVWSFGSRELREAGVVVVIQEEAVEGCMHDQCDPERSR